MSKMISKAPETIEYKQIPAGVYPARCFQLIDLGTHVGLNFDKTKEVSKEKIRIGWEFPTELAVFSEEKGEQPFTLFREYTNSLGEKANLRKDLEAWRGKAFTDEELAGFELDKLIGVACQIQVISEKSKKDPTKSYATINTIMGLPKGMTCPEAINEPILMTKDEWTDEYFDKVGKYVTEKIKSSVEYGFGSPSTSKVPTLDEAIEALPFE